MPARRAWLGHVGSLSALALCATGCLDMQENGAATVYVDDDVEIGEIREGLAGSGVQTENTSDVLGVYPEVMGYTGPTGSCTGTIVGPYAVLTASHCSAGGSVWWPSTGVSLGISSSLTSAYVDSAHWPRWWSTLNDQQIAGGGRTNDWPAQHDLRIAFVPSLTPSWLATHMRDYNLRPARIDAHAPTGQQFAVGVCSGGCSDREFIDVQYAASVPNNITQKNRDGYFNYATNGSYFTGIEAGDSGGPALGSVDTYWPPDTASGYVEGPRHVLSTHQGSGFYSDGGHNAPLAYDINLSLTTNQQYTVRLNQLWARAAVSDADQDGLPYECDSNPASASGSTNLCPQPLGTTDVDKPRGLLQCKPGFVATGIRGNAGWLIDEMAVRCTPTACLRQGASCAEEYWTDHFAGESGGGTAYTKTCNAGRAIVYVRGRHTAGTELNDLQLWCYDYAPLVDSGTFSGSQSLGTVGNSNGTLGNGTLTSWQRCANNGVITGFEARSDREGDKNLYWLTGIQPICSGPIDETAFHGSMGGTLDTLMCPDGYVGAGFVAAPYTPNPDYVGLLGLLCMAEADVGLTPTDARLVVAHGSYYLNGYVYPAMTERYTTFKGRHGLGASYVESTCPSGQTVTGATFATNVAGDGKFINRFYTYTCASAGGSTTTRNMLVGKAGGDYMTLSCAGAQRVAGMNIDSGWLTDGVGLVCR